MVWIRLAILLRMLMMRLSKGLVSFLIAAASLTITGCSREAEHVFYYCNPDGQTSTWMNEPIRIDLKEMMILGGDTSSTIFPLKTDRFLGFSSMFPLLLFGEAGETSEVVPIDGTVFHVDPIAGSFGDLWLIVAVPENTESPGQALRRSTVLYSVDEGVLAIGVSAFLGEQTLPVNYTPCGKKLLHYTDLVRIESADDKI